MTTRYTREQPAAPVDTIPGTYAPGAADDPDDVTGG